MFFANFPASNKIYILFYSYLEINDILCEKQILTPSFNTPATVVFELLH